MKIIIDNIATEYRDEGEGPVLLMLHGWKDSLRTFDAIAPLLAQTHRVVRLDLPGFGESEMPRSAWTLDAYVGFIATFVAKLHLDVDALIGHSLGGRIAIKGVAKGRLIPKKVVLIAAAGVSERNGLRLRTLKALAKVGNLATLPLPRRMRALLRARFYARIKSDYANAGALAETFKNIVREDLSASAREIKKPALLIWGADDDQTPLEEGARLSELIRGSKLQVFQAAGHFVHQQHAEEVAKKIGAFI